MRGQTFPLTVGAELHATAGLEDGAQRPLVPISQTTFEGLGLAYQFEIGDTGPATALIVIHISGPYRYARQQ